MSASNLKSRSIPQGLGSVLGLLLLNMFVSDMDSGTEGTQKVKEGDSATAKCLLFNNPDRVKNKQTNTNILVTNTNIFGDED